MQRRPSFAKPCLLIIDMINEFDFDGGARLLPAVERTARHIAAVKRRMKHVRCPVVYVNDNFGKWRSDFRKLVARCLDEHCRGKQVARLLAPEGDDYFVLKPKHSGFYATPLELLLRYLKVDGVASPASPAITACCSPLPTPTCGTSASPFRRIASYL